MGNKSIKQSIFHDQNNGKMRLNFNHNTFKYQNLYNLTLWLSFSFSQNTALVPGDVLRFGMVFILEKQAQKQKKEAFCIRRYFCVFWTQIFNMPSLIYGRFDIAVDLFLGSFFGSIKDREEFMWRIHIKTPTILKKEE